MLGFSTSFILELLLHGSSQKASFDEVSKYHHFNQNFSQKYINYYTFPRFALYIGFYKFCKNDFVVARTRCDTANILIYSHIL